MIGNIKSYGWTAMLVTNESGWCRFKPYYGLAVSSDGLECDTLDPNVKMVVIEFDENENQERNVKLIMRQKETGATFDYDFSQEKGDEKLSVELELL